MSNYTRTINFTEKDTFPSGTAAKAVTGTEIDSELDAIATASATKADKASPVFTGTSTFAALTATGLATLASVDINGGAIDGTTIGATTPSSGAFTTLSASGGITGALTGDVTGDLTGTVLTAAQPNITSVGALSSLSVTGNLTVDTNTLFVDSVNNRVGVNKASPTVAFDVVGEFAVSGQTTLAGNLAISKLNPALQMTPSGTAAFIDQVTAGAALNLRSRNALSLLNTLITMEDDVVTIGSGANDLVVDSSGNVGIGTTSPAVPLHIADSIAQIRLEDTDVAGAYVNIGAGSAGNLFFSADPSNSVASTSMTFSIDGSEAMRIDSSGNLLVGKTSAAFGIDGVINYASGATAATTTSGPASYLNRNGTLGTIQSIYSNGVAVGSISVTASATSFNTSSDERLKTNVIPATSAWGLLKNYQINSFDWIADGSHQDYGVIAQQHAAVNPLAVSKGEGPHDMWGVDPSKDVYPLIKAFQEAQERIELLESKVTALEAV